MTFEKKISLGNLISIVTILGSALAAWRAVEIKISAQDVKVGHLESQRNEDRMDFTKRLDKMDEKLDKSADKLDRVLEGLRRR